METYEEIHMKLIWSGLADEKYYDYIAKYCLPSWIKLPGEKYIIHDSSVINIKGLNIIDWQKVPNNSSKFLTSTDRKKSLNFWRKMQSQVWAIRNLKECDALILLDTDIEVLDFDERKFNLMLDDFLRTDYIWATGESQRRGHDSGFIVFNVRHPKLSELTDYYENMWDSGRIFDLKKSYDGHVVESMFEQYPSYKIPNADYGSGFHVYDLGFVHYGSKIPKRLRQTHKGSGAEIVKEFTADKIIKKTKHPWAEHGPWKSDI